VLLTSRPQRDGPGLCERVGRGQSGCESLADDGRNRLVARQVDVHTRGLPFRTPHQCRQFFTRTPMRFIDRPLRLLDFATGLLCCWFVLGLLWSACKGAVGNLWHELRLFVLDAEQRTWHILLVVSAVWIAGRWSAGKFRNRT
jgi:hypothetical protein